MDRLMKPKDGGEKGAMMTTGRFPDTSADRVRLLAVCLMSFSIALSDTAPSALLPSIEK